MEVRPLAERIEGLDAVLRRDDVAATFALRFTVAELLGRHDALLALLERTWDPQVAVACGMVPSWPEHAELVDGVPLHGVELLPCALATLRGVPDRAAVVAEAARVHPLLSDPDDLPTLVVRELLECLVLADLGARLGP